MEIKSSAVSGVVKYIRSALEEGEYVPGSALPPQRQLAEYLGVSRNVVREAMRILEGHGILYSKRGSGIYVKHTAMPLMDLVGAKNGRYTLRQILELCRIIWRSSMFSVVERATFEEIDVLRENNKKLTVNFSSTSTQDRFIYESSFGMNICKLSENELLYSLMAQFLTATTEIDYLIVDHPEYQTVLSIDASIINALLTQNAYRAYFLGIERDLLIDKLLESETHITDATYSLTIQVVCK